MGNWALLYQAKRQGNAENMSLWRSQQAYMIGAPLQVMAVIQGTHAAYNILRKNADKSAWVDPKNIVRKLTKAWSLFLLMIFPFGCFWVLLAKARGTFIAQQGFALIMCAFLSIM